MKRLFLVLGFLILLGTLVFALPTAQKTTLMWNAVTTNTDGTPATDLGGYKVYWSTQAGVFTDVNSKDVGNITTANIKDTAGNLKGTYYFVVTAYDTAGNESAFSNSVNATFLVNKVAPTNLMIQ